MSALEILLTYRDQELGSAWRDAFVDLEGVEFLHGDITGVACDAIVSPANSFGFMDGGLDYALSERFGWEMQDRLQERIHALPERELLVGRAMVLETEDEKVPWLIVAPTMRVPMSFQINTSVNAYLAMKALLIEAGQHDQIQRVAVPGLCTGVGRMPPEIAATQMRKAYDEVVLGRVTKYEDFGEAQLSHCQLNPNGKIWE